MEEIAAVPVRPDLARVYIEGWQSWSAAGLFPVGAPPPVTDAGECGNTGTGCG